MWSQLLSKILVLTVSGVLATPWHPVIRTDLDFFAPEFSTPLEGDVWIVDKPYTVTWRTDDLPINLTNVDDTIKLYTKGATLPIILAANIDLPAGRVQVVAPWVVSGEYQLVLFGEYGSISDPITIKNA